jgi:hypothetical protein
MNENLMKMFYLYYSRLISFSQGKKGAHFAKTREFDGTLS